MSAPEDDDFICAGDMVELVIDSRLWGMAIGFAGTLIYVRHMGGAIGQYHKFELRKMVGVDSGGSAEDNAPEDNVIDFTNARDLRKTKTKGSA